jgi:hypothetical protein
LIAINNNGNLSELVTWLALVSKMSVLIKRIYVSKHYSR